MGKYLPFIYVPKYPDKLSEHCVIQLKDRTADRLRCLMINHKHVITLIHKKIKLCFSTKITGYRIHHYATLKNISVISLRLVLLVEETWVPEENHWPVASDWQSVSHNVESSTSRHEWHSSSQLQWWQALIAQVFVNPTTIW